MGLFLEFKKWAQYRGDWCGVTRPSPTSALTLYQSSRYCSFRLLFLSLSSGNGSGGFGSGGRGNQDDEERELQRKIEEHRRQEEEHKRQQEQLAREVSVEWPLENLKLGDILDAFVYD